MSPADLKRFLARPGYAIAGGSRSVGVQIVPHVGERPKRKAAKRTGPPTVDPLVAAFFAQNGIPPATPEYRFAAPRKWRSDYAWPEHKVALEVEGAVWTNGRHTRGSGFVLDMEKYNSYACLGWRLIRVTPKQLISANTADMLRRLFTP